MNLRPLLERLADGDIIVADGALGTMLRERGLKQGECPELVTLEHPDWLKDIASAYLEAGAEIIQANTFGGSPSRLSVYGLEDSTEEINSRAVEIARRVAGERAYVAASCGPTGLKTDPQTIESIRVAFERQLRAILYAGVDVIIFETMSDLTEATLAVQTARQLAPEIPIMATMTFDATSNGFKTYRGITIAQACGPLAEAGADAIGSNCGEGSAQMVEIAREFRAHTALPLIMQPNAGLPSAVNGRLVYPETPEFMAEQAKTLLNLGVQVVGGCCGNTPEHVRTLRALVDHRKKR